MNSYRVYVLRNREGQFYVGLSDDIEKRRAQHNSGGSRWMKTRGPWTLSRGKVRAFRLAMPQPGKSFEASGTRQGILFNYRFTSKAHNPAAAGPRVQIPPPQPNARLNSYRVYVLRNPKGHFYTGFSENLDIRVQQHNAGMSRSTRGQGLGE
jgi:predicted GIY-YIG superfamily endonuclease